MDLNGKIILITGSSGGIGAATAKAFSEKGARVAIHYHQNKAGAEKTKKACGAELCLQADLENVSDCRKLVQTVLKKFGRIDGLVNNAGMSLPKDANVSLEERFDRQFAVNTRAPLILAEEAQPHMQSGSCIVNVSSIRAFRAKKTASILAVYGASKAALAYLTKSMALAWAPRIRINAVAPGYVHTEMLESFYGGKFEPLIDETPMGRLIRPEEIASAIVFLCENDAITGQVLAVDGGYLLG